jgi:hypothetical protein
MILWAKVAENQNRGRAWCTSAGSAARSRQLDDDRSEPVVINRTQKPHLREMTSERIDARPISKTRTVNETKITEKNAATDPRPTIPTEFSPGCDEPSYVRASSGNLEQTWIRDRHRRTAERERRRSSNNDARVRS